MIPPSLVFGAIGSAINPIYEFYTAQNQRRMAEKIDAGNKRPIMGIPQGITQSEDLARGQYLDKNLPGQSIMQNRIEGNSASAISAAQQSGNPADALSAISAINANENNSTNELGLKAAQRVDANSLNLQNNLEKKAGYEQQVWDYNQNQPYQKAAAASSALKEASLQNKNSAFKGIGGDIAGTAGAYEMNKLFNTNPDITAATSQSKIKAAFGNKSGGVPDLNGIPLDDLWKYFTQEKPI